MPLASPSGLESFLRGPFGSCSVFSFPLVAFTLWPRAGQSFGEISLRFLLFGVAQGGMGVVLFKILYQKCHQSDLCHKTTFSSCRSEGGLWVDESGSRADKATDGDERLPTTLLACLLSLVSGLCTPLTGGSRDSSVSMGPRGVLKDTERLMLS